ncbi:uncharacterized protein LOC123658926 [Melitaea cinxia]|uniref:uncharacterized protein LOC123658926 n=1 Tax=Melitaea cinxia TaxID=113334 RepID=UPI001E2741CF|nr:uncharacterized protein LOC123658926 [Melitaea cinxia]
MEIFYQNVNRIRTKINEIYSNVLNNDYDVICLTETNLNNSVYDNEILDTRYHIFRRDRCTTCIGKGDGGGVLLGIKREHNVIRRYSWDSMVEDLWITVLPSDDSHKSIHICICYLPPDISLDLLELFYNSCTKIIMDAKSTDEFVLIGDFNTPHITWMKNGDTLGYSAVSPQDNKANYLIEFVSVCGLVQFNGIPNRINRYLDLILSSIECSTCEAEPLCSPDSHHPALVAVVTMPSASKNLDRKRCKRYNYNKCNFDKLNRDIEQTDWQQILSSSDIDVDVQQFYKELIRLIGKSTPMTDVHSSAFPMIEESLCCNIKSFWSYVQDKKCSNSNIPSTMNYVGYEASSRKEICELFAKYFSSVYSNNSANCAQHSDFLNYPEPNDSINSLAVNEHQIKLKIKNIDEHKGSGPDGIPPVVYKRCIKTICVPLCVLFNKSLKSGTFPTLWKTAHIVPVFKSGDKSCCENYRPISILSCCAKLFESIVYDVLYNHFKSSLSPNQHGFVKGRSTTSNLLEYKSYLCKVFAKCGQVDSIYTDFSKAFDRVNHSILTHKLARYGVHGNLLRWVESYLSRRTQLVALKGELSSVFTVPSGVPQGSHLGPLFFNIFVNDLTLCLKSPCLLYADDLKIYQTITCINDAMKLQGDLDTIARWCQVAPNSAKVAASTSLSHMTESIRRKINGLKQNYRI